MPHATDGEEMADEGNSFDLRELLLGNGDAPRLGSGDKADDAVDFDDISDDDLPEEEEATNDIFSREDDEYISAALGNGTAGGGGGLAVQPPASRTNALHDNDDFKEQANGDLFGEADDGHELFGDHSSSPEQQRSYYADQGQARTQRAGGLALPSKSSLALPGANGNSQSSRQQQHQQSLSSMSPPSMMGDGYSPAASDADDSSDDENLPENERVQRRLFRNAARKQKGEIVEEDIEAIDMDVFYSLFPSFERNQNPDFVKLFPPRPAQYRAKVPLKPPRAIIPSKLSLDLMADQEKAFRAPAFGGGKAEDHTWRPGYVSLNLHSADLDDSDDDMVLSVIDENERIGDVTMQDLAVICGDWDIPSSDLGSPIHHPTTNGDWNAIQQTRPYKKRRILDSDLSRAVSDPRMSFEEPERTVARLAKSVALDLNDQHLLVDETLPTRKRKTTHDSRRGIALNRGAAKRYNISNDEAYDQLKENHQSKVRSTLGGMTIEHSLPATKLQYPFYKVNLDSRARRAFHRPNLDVRDGRNREFKFQKIKHVKRKNIRGKETKELFAHAEDLGLGDNSSMLLLEYSEEAPIMLSNFGMGSKLLNYYRKRDADDSERPKREIGETHVLLTQDKSPFANFGHVDKGEVVPTLHNGLYRAPIFQHKPKPTDFVVGLSTTYQGGNRFYLRNMENLHTVGQQLPTSEVPTKHSRKVTDAAKKRLRALSYRMYTKSVDPTRPKAKALNNENLMPHLPGHDMPQTRSKMREFMKYERAPGKDSGGIWVPMPGQIVPDAETLRSWIKPEDVCLLDSMQAGVQHLSDLGIQDDGKDGEDDKDLDEGEHIEKQLAPWRATKNFLNATQGKAMLLLFGEGDPTGRGEGYSFVKTSMKGGFAALGESTTNDKMLAKKRKDAGGHSYNVAEQQRQYDSAIRGIWNKQKGSLAADIEHSDIEMDDDIEEPENAYPSGRGATPRSSFVTPARGSRQDDDSASQLSRGSVGRRADQTMIITRQVKDKFGTVQTMKEEVTDPKVIAAYRKRQKLKRLQGIDLKEIRPGEDGELNALKKQELERELARLSRNKERREAREKQKGIFNPGSPSGAASPGQSDTADGTTPQKGRGRNKDGTARKCANCGQVGHIKTNRKSVFWCSLCGGYQDSVPLVSSNTTPTSAAKGKKRRSDVNGTAVDSPLEGPGAAFSYAEFKL